MNDLQRMVSSTGTHDELWAEEIDSTSSETGTSFEYIGIDKDLNSWNLAFQNETRALHHKDEITTESQIASYTPPADMEFYRRNNDRLDLLVRKYSDSTNIDNANEENARLKILERQIELVNQRFKDIDFEAVDNIFSHIEELKMFKKSKS